MDDVRKPDASTALLADTAVQPGFGLVLDVGPQRRKRVRRLKRGTGKLTTRVASVVNEARAKFGLGDDVEIVPVVILYRYDEEEIAPPHTVARLEDDRV